MKAFRNLTSVLYEPWMMMPEAVEAYLPMIEAWLTGQPLQLEEKGKMEVLCAFAGGVSPGEPEHIADFPAGSVAVVNLKGELTKYDGWCNYGSVSIANLVKQLGMAKNISGVMLDIDGPGGAVSAIAPMVEAIQFVQQMGKPIGGHADLIASAHYYVGMHCDFLMLDNMISSRAGSIGTMITIQNYRERLASKGIKLENVYAEQSTHKNQEFEQAMEGKTELLKKNLLNPLAARFQEDVRLQRGDKLNEMVDGLLNGSMFFAKDAVNAGLVDEIGNMGNALQRVFDMIEIRKFMR